MIRAAGRAAGLALSPIRRLTEGGPPEALPLALGEPTWELPRAARRALAEDRGRCAYGPNSGLPELRRSVAALHRAKPEEVVITTGCQGGLHAFLQGWIEAGDRVLVPDPGFVAYPSLAALAGGTVETYRLGAGFRLEPQLLIERLDEVRPKLVIVNLPGNPTGGAVEAADLARVARACEERGVLLLSDEVYRELHLGRRPPSLREVSSWGVVASSVSKGWGAPGLRVGWLVGDPCRLEPAARVHALAATAASEPAQRAALALLEASDEVLPAARRELAARWQALAQAFAEEGWPACGEPPDGGFYLWLPLPPGAVADPWAFCRRLRDEARVLLVPGLAFGEAGRAHVRLSFAAEPDVLRQAVGRLAPFWRGA